MPHLANPYDWQSHNPRVEIPRTEADRVAGTLREGGSAVVLGGRGMGKSVILRQIRAANEVPLTSQRDLGGVRANEVERRCRRSFVIFFSVCCRTETQITSHLL